MFSSEGEAKISEQFSKRKSGVEIPYFFTQEEMFFRMKRAENPAPLVPYVVDDVDASDDAYVVTNGVRSLLQDPREEEELLDRYINRVLLSVTMNDCEGEEFGIANVENGIVKRPDYLEKVKPAHYTYDADKAEEKAAKQRAGKKNRRRHPSGDGTKFEDCVDEEVKKYPKGYRIHVNKHNDEMISMPLHSYRKFIHTEINSRARDIHEFYERQWRLLSCDRVDSLRELVTCQDYCRRLQNDLTAAENDIQEYKNYCENLQRTVTANREAKKRRRQAKKQRKTDTTSLDVCPEDGSEEAGDSKTSDLCPEDDLEDDSKENGGTGVEQID